MSLLCTQLLRTVLKREALTLLFFPMCRSCYVFTVPRLLEEGLLRIKPAGTMIFWVSPRKPLFAQPSLVDPQPQNSFASGLSEPLPQANPTAYRPTAGEELQLNGAFTHFHVRPKNLSLQGRPGCHWTLLAPETIGDHCQPYWYC